MIRYVAARPGSTIVHSHPFDVKPFDRHRKYILFAAQRDPDQLFEIHGLLKPGWAAMLDVSLTPIRNYHPILIAKNRCCADGWKRALGVPSREKAPTMVWVMVLKAEPIPEGVEW